jgi:hypothetical protein
MSWTRYDSDAPRYDDPLLTVYSNLNGYVNAAADYKWFDDYDWADIHTDAERDLLAIEPQPDGEGALKLSRRHGLGADLSFKPPLEHDLGFDTGDLDETYHVPLEWDDEHGWAVADLSALRDGDTGDHEPTNGGQRGDDADTDDRWCSCGHGPTSERGIRIHAGRTHDDDEDWEILDHPPEDSGDSNDEEDLSDDLVDNLEADASGNIHDEHTVIDDGDGDAAVPDPESAVSNDTVSEVAQQVETLSELADLLDTSTGEARLLARKAGVLTDVRDDMERMGVGNP